MKRNAVKQALNSALNASHSAAAVVCFAYSLVDIYRPIFKSNMRHMMG